MCSSDLVQLPLGVALFGSSVLGSTFLLLVIVGQSVRVLPLWGTLLIGAPLPFLHVGMALPDALRNGSAELGVLPISEILPLAGVELAGAFPADMQTYIVMVAGVSAKTAQAAGVRQLIEFLTAPAALPVVTAIGL